MSGMKGRGPRAPTEERPSNSAGGPPPHGRLRAQAMADPVYNGIDLIALTFAVVLAAAVVLLVSHLMPHLADLMPGSTG